MGTSFWEIPPEVSLRYRVFRPKRSLILWVIVLDLFVLLVASRAIGEAPGFRRR
ncbi:hypothetical protein [Candidatus Methylacidithermus pantelleriae]|uniref:hypothetical protein n=1 Tax=Candidatus Methylacidithermus pantelleriae TaxID=2744239 RepID=UPI001BD4E0F7|nr:hypothetical protein [Candidatus Methylacidithermus pantelleriae]